MGGLEEGEGVEGVQLCGDGGTLKVLPKYRVYYWLGSWLFCSDMKVCFRSNG